MQCSDYVVFVVLFQNKRHQRMLKGKNLALQNSGFGHGGYSSIVKHVPPRVRVQSLVMGKKEFKIKIYFKMVFL